MQLIKPSTEKKIIENLFFRYCESLSINSYELQLYLSSKELQKWFMNQVTINSDRFVSYYLRVGISTKDILPTYVSFLENMLDKFNKNIINNVRKKSKKYRRKTGSYQVYLN